MHIYNTTKNTVPFDGLQQMQSDKTSGIDLVALVMASQKNGSLILCIPWIIELLKMAFWDTTFHTRSNAFEMTISVLRDVQERLRNDLWHQFASGRNDLSNQLVLWSLESFFGNHLGLAQVASFPSFSEYPNKGTREDLGPVNCGNAVDATFESSGPVFFGLTILFSVSPHLEEMFSLAAVLARAEVNRISTRSPGISRKLRPSIVSREIASFDNDSNVSNTDKLQPFPSNGNILPLETSGNISMDGMRSGGSSLESKMADAFFHQHQEIKEICEFVVRRVLKQMVKIIPEQISLSSGGSTSVTDHDRADNLLNEMLEFLSESLTSNLDKTLQLLEPPNTDPKIRGLAVELAVAKGYESGKPLVHNIIARNLDSIQRSLFKGGPIDLQAIADQKLKPQNQLLSALTTQINKLLVSSSKSYVDDKSWLLPEMLDVLQHLASTWSTSTDPNIPPESLLREHFEAVSKLDTWSISFFDQYLDRPEETCCPSRKQRWLVIASFLTIASRLSRPPRRGLSRVRELFKDQKKLTRLISLGLQSENSATVAELLLDFVEGLLVSTRSIEKGIVAVREKEDHLTSSLLGDFVSGLHKRRILADPVPLLSDDPGNCL